MDNLNDIWNYKQTFIYIVNVFVMLIYLCYKSVYMEYVLTRVLHYRERCYNSNIYRECLVNLSRHTGNTVHAHKSVMNERERESASCSHESFFGRSRRRILCEWERDREREREREKEIGKYFSQEILEN